MEFQDFIAGKHADRHHPESVKLFAMCSDIVLLWMFFNDLAGLLGNWIDEIYSYTFRLSLTDDKFIFVLLRLAKKKN